LYGSPLDNASYTIGTAELVACCSGPVRLCHLVLLPVCRVWRRRHHSRGSWQADLDRHGTSPGPQTNSTGRLDCDCSGVIFSPTPVQRGWRLSARISKHCTGTYHSTCNSHGTVAHRFTTLTHLPACEADWHCEPRLPPPSLLRNEPDQAWTSVVASLPPLHSGY